MLVDNFDNFLVEMCTRNKELIRGAELLSASKKEREIFT